MQALQELRFTTVVGVDLPPLEAAIIKAILYRVALRPEWTLGALDLRGLITKVPIYRIALRPEWTLGALDLRALIIKAILYRVALRPEWTLGPCGATLSGGLPWHKATSPAGLLLQAS
ncbi:MAG: hypothetical protein CXZ00_00710 [Acidobacteria bacterium]|nr:MAG: hypothetical protein CXZ00_00710 [Acidobacteriota bacterium]